MTTEQKAKAYDKALEKMKSKLKGFNEIIISRNDIEELFPELKDSEDERIRKELITHCKNTRCVTEEGAEQIATWIAWLEKTKWTEEDECYMSECISAIATKDGWSFEEKRKTKHWLKSLKQRVEE